MMAVCPRTQAERIDRYNAVFEQPVNALHA